MFSERGIFPQLPASKAFRILRLILVLTWSIGALGIVAWAYVTRITPTPTLGRNSPTISGVGGNVTVGRNSPTISDVGGPVTVVYYENKEALRANAEGNLRKCIQELNGLLTSQNSYLLPAMQKYIESPSPETWDLVRSEVKETQSRLQAAVHSVIDYDSEQTSSMRELHQNLFGKETLLAQLPQNPPDAAFATAWNTQFGAYVEQVSAQLQALRAKLLAEPKD